VKSVRQQTTRLNN